MSNLISQMLRFRGQDLGAPGGQGQRILEPRGRSPGGHGSWGHRGREPELGSLRAVRLRLPRQKEGAVTAGTVKAHLGGFLRLSHLSGLHDVGEVPIGEDPAAEREARLPTVPRPQGPRLCQAAPPGPYSLQPLAGGESGKGVRVPSELPLVVAVVSSPLEEQNRGGHAPCAGMEAGRWTRAAGGARAQGLRSWARTGFCSPALRWGVPPTCELRALRGPPSPRLQSREVGLHQRFLAACRS